jgi:peroxiredoxin
MRKLFTIGFASIIICTSCQRQNEVSEASISGVIQNHQKEKDLKLNDVLGKSEWRQVIEVNDNSFELGLDIDKPVIKMLEYDNIRKDIFIQPSKSLKIFFDTENGQQYVKYDGDLAMENTILDSVAAKVRNIDYAFVYGQELDAAAKYVDSVKKVSMDLLNRLTKANPTSSEFIEYTSAYIDYNLSGLKIMLGERKDTQPDNYYKFLEKLTVTDPHLLDIPEYRMFLYFYIKRESNLAIKNLDSIQQQLSDIEFTESLKVIAQLENKEVRDYSLYNAMIMKLKDSGIDEFDNYHDYFKEHNTDQHYTEQMKIAYAEKKVIAPGKQAPQFTLTDINNEEKSLSDFKGQYVLLDFWNSRCGICRRELPHFMELESDFKNENIAFVSISNDPDLEMWKTYVKENKNIGTSLYTEKFWDSEIFKAYQVQGTPTYVLIDKEGKIIDPVAPKPSSSDLKKLLNSVLEIQ